MSLGKYFFLVNVCLSKAIHVLPAEQHSTVISAFFKASLAANCACESGCGRLCDSGAARPCAFSCRAHVLLLGATLQKENGTVSNGNNLAFSIFVGCWKAGGKRRRTVYWERVIAQQGSVFFVLGSSATSRNPPCALF